MTAIKVYRLKTGWDETIDLTDEIMKRINLGADTIEIEIVNETKKKKMNIEELMEKLPEGAIIYNNKYYYEYYKDIRAFEDGIAKIMSGKDNATFTQFIQRVVENE